MAKKWIALNILLLAVVAGLAMELHQQYEQFKTKSDPVKTDPIPVENQAAAKIPSGTPADTFMETPIQTDADYFIISEKTLFSETRGREDIQSPAAPTAVPPLNPRPVLVGTSMISGQYTASIMDPAAAVVRGGQIISETKRVGDIHRGYTITSIDADQMVFENGGQRVVVPLNRTARRVQNVRPPAAASASRVVSIGPGGGAGGAVALASAAAGRAAQTAAQTAAQNAAARQQQIQQQQIQQQIQQAQQQNQRVSVPIPADGNITFTPEQVIPPPVQATQQNQVELRAAQKPQPAQKPPQQQQQQQRTVRSPFGDIIRPVPE